MFLLETKKYSPHFKESVPTQWKEPILQMQHLCYERYDTVSHYLSCTFVIRKYNIGEKLIFLMPFTHVHLKQLTPQFLRNLLLLSYLPYLFEFRIIRNRNFSFTNKTRVDFLSLWFCLRKHLI